MIGLFMALAFLMAMFGKNDGSPTGDDRINDIIAAKAYVRSLLNYPESLFEKKLNRGERVA